MKVVPVRAVKPIQSANDYTQVRAVSVRAVAAVGCWGHSPWVAPGQEAEAGTIRRRARVRAGSGGDSSECGVSGCTEGLDEWCVEIGERVLDAFRHGGARGNRRGTLRP